MQTIRRLGLRRLKIAEAGSIGRRRIELTWESEACEFSSIVAPSFTADDFARAVGDSFDEDIVHAERANPLARQLDHFASVVRGEARPLVGGRDALQTLRATLGSHVAAMTGERVHLSSDDTTAPGESSSGEEARTFAEGKSRTLPTPDSPERPRRATR